MEHLNFINDFEQTFICDNNGNLDVTNTPRMSKWWTTYGDMLCKYESVIKFSFLQFSDSNTRNQDIAKSMYLFGIRCYNNIKDC